MQSHKAWIRKANHDLAGAKLLLREAITDLAVYHAHQCAEKALKGFLAFKLAPIQKSHDLVVLAELCCSYDPSFEELKTLIVTLNPFGTITRYPSDRPDPDNEMTLSAIQNAEIVLDFVNSRLLV